MTSARGRWYVIGRDVGRMPPRMFKLSRIQDRPKNVSRPGAYAVPENLDVRSLARSLSPREPTASAKLGIRAGKAPALRRRGTPSVADSPLPGGFEITRSATASCIMNEIVRYAADVIVLEPVEPERGSPRPGNAWPQHNRTRPVRHDSQAQVRRLLSLVPYLRDHDGARMAEVAEAFGISEATLRDDLNVLWMCGMPGLTPGDLIDIDMDAVDGEGVIHLSNADYLTRLLRLSAEEAMALVLGLQALHEIAGPGEQDAIERASKKLEEASGGVVVPDQASVSVTAARGEIQARLTDGLAREAARSDLRRCF